MTNLQQAVIEQLGYDELCEECKGTLEDVANHGADGGFGGFIYYTDTCAFFEANRSAIVALAVSQACDLGIGTAEMIAGFNCLDVETAEVFNVLAGCPEDEATETQIKNALAWYALEETARELTEV